MEIRLASNPVAQLAIVVEDVPNAVIRSVAAFGAWLDSEMRFQIDRAMDAHCVAAIAAATLPNGQTGADLIAQVRNAITAMHDAGANPTLLVLNGSDAAALDLSVQPGTNDYIFASQVAGAGGPVWSLRAEE